MSELKQFFCLSCCKCMEWNTLPAECTNLSSLTSFRLSLLSVDFSKFFTIDWYIV